MPMIITKTTTAISKEQEQALTRSFGEAIALLPGKSEEWLMLSFEEGARMAFRGNSENDLCYIEVNLLGKANREAYDRLTARLCEIVTETLGVPSECIYVKYEEANTWGYNGFNF